MEKEWLASLAPYRNHTLILGCSGGVDSMVLLHFLIQNQFELHVVHVNYNQRNEESVLDQKLVENMANSNGVPIHAFRYSQELSKSLNFQEAARIFRYECLEEIQDLYAKSKIILAHHADDQVETFFMNLSRKSGLIGLAGMPAIRHDVIRPLIWTFKAEILAYAMANNVIWREDASNNSNKYYRNRWRNEFIPFMENEICDLKNLVVLLMKGFREEQKSTEIKINEIHENILVSKQLETDKVESLSNEEQFELWRQLGQSSGTFEKFEQLIHLKNGKKVKMKGDFVSVTINRGGSSGNEKSSLHFLSFEEDTKPLPQLISEDINELPFEFSKNYLYLDQDLISGKLTLRLWKNGDRIASIGVDGTQLVSDIIKDAKIPYHQKNEIFVVEDASEIHWVVGLKIGRKAIAQKSTKHILKLGIRIFEEIQK